MSARVSFFTLLVLLISAGCANITAPTGGKKDIRGPRLVSLTPRDSLLNTHVSRIELYFDEYITVNDPAKEVHLSPILTIAPTVSGLNKHVIVKIIDSLLEPNTTYRLTFGNAIKDVHEGNPFSKYSYTFSTGSYFDSLQLRGTVKNAETGLADQEGVVVELYYASDNDSAIVRHKPKYVTKVEADGKFVFKGLPNRTFRIYAVKDANESLVYDGPAQNEMVGFVDNTVIPNDTSMAPINIRIFAEIPDTSAQKSIDSVKEKPKMGKSRAGATEGTFTYSVNIDTSDKEKKTFDVTGPVKITFSRLPALNKDKITLTYDNMGVETPVSTKQEIDSATRILKVTPAHWKENTIYTLRLAKGFAKDTAGSDLMPSRYTFRTQDEDNYGEITMHLPTKYNSDMYLLKVMMDKDSIYQKPITDTLKKLSYLKPGKYTFRIIVDKNRNGKWDAGELLAKKQPEEVIPYIDPVNLKAGWKNTIDFEPKAAPTKTRMGSTSKPK